MDCHLCNSVVGYPPQHVEKYMVFQMLHNIYVFELLFILHSLIWSLDMIVFVAISGFVLAFVDNATIWFWRVLVDQHLQKQGRFLPSHQQTSIINQPMISQQSAVFHERNDFCQNRKYSEIQLLLVRNIFSLYIGWITVAGTVILGLVCVHWWGLTLCQQFILFWISTPIAATALYLFMALKLKNEYKYCWGYILAVIWGITGAAINSFNNIQQRNYC